jgi:hypothetical protein
LFVNETDKTGNSLCGVLKLGTFMSAISGSQGDEFYQQDDKA